MKAGILSDTHDCRASAERALETFLAEGVGVIVHLGDVCAGFTLGAYRACGIPLVGVYGNNDGDRLLLVNLGRDLTLAPAPEPLLAPPEGMRWDGLWSSEDPRYGGAGTPRIESDDRGWHLPGESTVVMWPVPRERA